MTNNFTILSIILSFVVFGGLSKAGTFLPTENNAEEEEKKESELFGNYSFRATFPPDDISSEVNFFENKIPSADDNVLWSRGLNFTDYEDPLEETKHGVIPENSVDVENVNYFLAENPDLEPSAHFEFMRERPSNRTESVSSSTVSSIVSSRHNSARSCVFGERKCKETENEGATESAGLRTSQAPAIHSSSTLILWGAVTTVTPQEVVSPVLINTSTPAIKEIESQIETTTSSITTTAQTSENIIVVDDDAVDKDDSVIQLELNKNDKMKLVKENHDFDQQFNSIPIKLHLTTSVMTEDKRTPILPDSGLTSELLSSSQVMYISTSKASEIEFLMPLNPLQSRKINENVTTSSAFTEKDAKNLLDKPHKELENTHSSLSSSTVTESSDKSDPMNGNKIKSHTDKLPIVISSSFREPTTVPDIPLNTHRFSIEDTIYPTTSRSFVTTTSTRQSYSTIVNEELSTSEDTKADPESTTDKENGHLFPAVKEVIPPPRLSNPTCSSLPVCIEITLLETTWEEFCSQISEFKDFLSKSVSHYTRPITLQQIVMDTQVCSKHSSVRSVQTTPDITVNLYITNDSGEYEERLTEICGIVLKKWAPTAFRSSVLEVRLYNSEVQSTPLPLLPEINSGFVAAVSISAVAGVALCMLCILLVVMKQKLLQGRNSDTTTPTADAYSLDSLSINASFRRRRTRRSARSYLNHAFSDQEIPSHPLNEKTLSNCLKSRDLLEEEFKKIPMNMPKLDSIPEGAHAKNRYSNILPRMESRVVLADSSGDPLKCYINANYIKGYDGKSAFYIACQAPLPEGIEDFWRMVWEQQCRAIIMLTMLEENGTSRCALYFPQSTLVSQQPFGDFQVSLVKKDVYEFYTMSTLRILDLEKNLFRDVIHLWFTSWPNVGVPKDPSSLIIFIQQCRSYIGCNAGPTVVHCSTGTGRTGVFLSLDICMREYDESRSVDILQCVSRLRRDRAGAVQNKDQYILIHEAMMEYISRIENKPSANNKTS